MDADVAETVKSVGEEQYKHFKEERLKKCTKPITDVIPKNKLPFFSRPPVKAPSKKQFQLAALKSDFSLFSRLYASCQACDGDLDKFFSHENQAAPPSLSEGGRMQLEAKSDLLSCIIQQEASSLTMYPSHWCRFLRWCLCPGTAKTFQDYAENIFVPYVAS